MDKELEMNLEEVSAEVTENEEAAAEVEEIEEITEEAELTAEVEELTAEDVKEPAKKGGKPWIFALVAVAIALAIIFFVASPMMKGEEDGENSGVTEVNYDETVLKIGEIEFSLSDFNYMYVSSFNEIYSNLYSYYGETVAYIVDITKPLEEQMIDETTDWDTYVVNYTVDSLKNIVGLYEAAKSEGFVLPEEYQADLDSIEAQLTEAAAQGDMTLEEYVTFMYGEGITFENLYNMTEMRYIAGVYAEEYEASIEITEEDMNAYYEANKTTIDTVDFRYFSIFYDSETEPVLTKEEAEERANTLKETTNGQEFNDIAYEFCNDEQKEYFTDDADPTLYAGANYDSTGIEEVSEWLFDEEREQGDVMVHFDETYKSYLVVMFESRNDPNYNLVDVRHILIAPEEDENGEITDEAWAAAETKANEILTGYLEGEMTEENFSALAAEHSEDGNAAQGGIYEDVYKGQMVAPFEDWCFDETRQPGDTGIVKTSFGYHIMYFVGVGDNNLESLIKPTLVNEQMNAWVKELSINLTAEKLPAFENVGKIIDDIINAANEAAKAETEEESSDESVTE